MSEPRWIPVSSFGNPDHGRLCLVGFRRENGADVVARAFFVPDRTEEDIGNYEGDDTVYDEEADCYYWPEGWYESNEFEGTNWRLADNVTHWMPLSALPPIPEETGE